MKSTAKLALVPGADKPLQNRIADQSHHDLLLALQTTLDVERLLELFSEHLRAAVPHTNYAFLSENAGLELKFGKRDRHMCSYRLLLETETLGEWRMSRSRRFSESELAMAEACLCRLLFPLRNALLYRRALLAAHTDPLTGLRNRAALSSDFQREWEFAKRHRKPLSVIMVDIDHFKRINDEHGHARGDEVLRQVAACLKETTRASDFVFRYGGEEFVALLGDTDAGGALQLAERIRFALENSAFRARDGEFPRVTASLGVATYTGQDENQETLLKRADQALYRAKNLGRNRVEAAVPLSVSGQNCATP
jgi:diguanylate cyclase (GGDEF)-like protein